MKHKDVFGVNHFHGTTDKEILTFQQEDKGLTFRYIVEVAVDQVTSAVELVAVEQLAMRALVPEKWNETLSSQCNTDVVSAALLFKLTTNSQGRSDDPDKIQQFSSN